MKVILCEKPSQARDIAEGLSLMGYGKPQSSKTSIRVGDYYLFWAQGHLLQVDVEKTKEHAKEFPYFPKRFFYKPTSNRAKFLLSQMKPKIEKAQEIIIATDFGREGELIARLILNHTNANKRAKYWRLWTSATLSPQVVKKAFSQLRPLKEFDSLYEEALARQIADWLVGINLSIQLMKQVKEKNWSIGRVQTPTLAIVVKRELEIKNFRPEPYTIVEAEFFPESEQEVSVRAKLLKSSALEEEKAEDSDIDETEKTLTQSEREKKLYGFSKALAFEIKKELENETKKAYVEKVEKKTVRERPHKLHTLTSLQTKLSKMYKFSLKQVADAAQWLYDHHYISYPRTESHYLHSDNYRDILEILDKLGHSDLKKRVNVKDKRVFDDKKVTDHHALIPQNKPKSFPNDIVKKTYEEIEKTFLAQFMDDYVEERLKLFIVVETEKGNRYRFVSNAARAVSLGWKHLYLSKKKDSNLLDADLKKDSILELEKVFLIDRETKPPQRYTQGSLVNVMKNAHLLIPKEQKELRKIMKEKDNPGLGTAATRTRIVQNLISRNYLEEDSKKFLHATEKAIKLIQMLVNKSKIADPIFTAQFEKKLSLIREEKLSKSRFLKEIEDFVLSEISIFEKELKVSELSDSSNLICPLCQKRSAKLTRNAVYCSNCQSWILNRNFFSKKLSDSQVRSLLEGKKIRLSGLKSKKTDKEFSAQVEYDSSKKRLRIVKFLNSKKKKSSSRKKNARQ